MQDKPLFFENLSPGMTFSAGPRRICREDINDFAKLSGDHTPLHTDEAYAATTPFRRIVAHGALNLSVATGLAYAIGIFSESVLAVKSMVVKFERPVFPDDHVSLELIVASIGTRKYPDRGEAEFFVRLRNQENRLVLSGTWVLLLRKGPV
jgi:acyl dehydratase